MEANNPELQEKLEELEHELEVSPHVFYLQETFGVRRVSEWELCCDKVGG